jgi:CubicO group peptidase (beta-lactamase class C family)
MPPVSGSSGTQSRAEALESVARWEVANVAAAVVEGSSRVDTVGETGRVFSLASVTKLLTSYAVLVAIEEGTLSLDMPMGPPGATLAHLLSHASGVGPDTSAPVTEVGTRRIYSTSAFLMIADALALAADMAFEQYVTEAVLRPLSLATTNMSGHPGAGATSTVHDLISFSRELLAPTLLNPSTMAVATRPWFPQLGGVLPGFGRVDPNQWGLGFELRDGKHPHWTSPLNSPRTFGHFGQAGTMLWVDPDRNIALVVLTDRGFGPWAADAWPRLASAVLLAR